MPLKCKMHKCKTKLLNLQPEWSRVIELQLKENFERLHLLWKYSRTKRMKVFPPSRKELKKPTSRFAKTIRLLSNFCVLPLRFNESYSEVKCSIFHLKSLASFLIITTPFFIVAIWYGLQPDFLQKYMEQNLMVYEMIDFIIVVILLGSVQKLYHWFCYFLCMRICLMYLWTSFAS